MPTKVISFVHVRQKVFNIQHPFYIIPRTGINRNTRISIFNDTLHHLLERGTDIQIDHIQARRHYLLHRFATKTDNPFQNIILLGDFRLIRQLQCMRQFIYGNIMILLGEVLVQESSRAHQDRSNRIEYLFQGINPRCGETAESQRLLRRINLRHDFTEQQQ